SALRRPTASALALRQLENPYVAVGSVAVRGIVAGVVGKTLVNALTLGPSQPLGDDRYLVSAHRHPCVGIRQQVRRPSRMTGLPEVAAHQEQPVAFTQVGQRYLAPLPSLAAGGREQQQWHTDRTEDREAATASPQKSVIQRCQLPNTPGAHPRTEDGGDWSQHKPSGVTTPSDIGKRVFAHSADYPPRPELVSEVHRIRRQAPLNGVEATTHSRQRLVEDLHLFATSFVGGLGGA